MSLPLVSVVVPAHNAERFLDETVRSLRDQTLRDLEIIVVDDGSTDGTRALAERHAAEDPRVSVVGQQNAGVAEARNHGLRLARAPWVALCDADDLALPERLERQLAFLDTHPEVAALGTHGWRVGEDGRELGVFDVGPYSPEHFAKLRANNEVIYLLASSVMFSRDRALELGGFRRFEGMAEDVDLWTRLADRYLVLTLTERLVLYRVHARSASTTRFFRQVEDALMIGENTVRRRAGQPDLSPAEFRARLQARPLPERLRRGVEWRSQYLYRVAGGLLANRRPAGLAWLAASFAVAPWLPAGRLKRQLVPWLKARLEGSGRQ